MLESVVGDALIALEGPQNRTCEDKEREDSQPVRRATSRAISPVVASGLPVLCRRGRLPHHAERRSTANLTCWWQD